MKNSNITPQISVLICTHNRGQLLDRTLTSLDRLDAVEGCSMDVVIVANACTDDTLDRARFWAKTSPWRAKVVDEPRPGLSIARNRAVAESSGDWCAFIDDDVRLAQNWLSGLAEVTGLNDFAFGGGRVLLWWEQMDKPKWFVPRLNNLLSENDLGETRQPLPKGYGLVGANFWVRRNVFDIVGHFDENIGRSKESLVGGEETDFIRRVEEAGLCGIYAPDVCLEHWVPRDRVNRAYLTGVARGNEYGRILIRPRMNPFVWSRCLLGHAYYLIRYRVTSIVIGALRGYEEATPDATKAATGSGGLQAIYDRLR